MRQSASVTMDRFILLAPYSRSTKVIGTSTTRKPDCSARQQDQPEAVAREATSSSPIDSSTFRKGRNGRILQRKAQGYARVGVSSAGEDLARGRPVHDLAARYPARAEDEICARCISGVRSPPQSLQQPRQLLRPMRAIGVHLDEDLVVSLESPAETSDVSGAKTLLGVPVEHMDLQIIGGQAIGKLPRPVWTGVVHNQDVDGWNSGANPATTRSMF
jgi:hypothetical protein